MFTSIKNQILRAQFENCLFLILKDVPLQCSLVLYVYRVHVEQCVPI